MLPYVSILLIYLKSERRREGDRLAFLSFQFLLSGSVLISESEPSKY
jgi:hypothetical protein